MKTNYLNARLFDHGIEREMKSIMYCIQEEETFARVNFANFCIQRIEPFAYGIPNFLQG